jgi:hypothetical protein
MQGLRSDLAAGSGGLLLNSNLQVPNSKGIICKKRKKLSTYGENAIMTPRAYLASPKNCEKSSLNGKSAVHFERVSCQESPRRPFRVPEVPQSRNLAQSGPGRRRVSGTLSLLSWRWSLEFVYKASCAAKQKPGMTDVVPPCPKRLQ